MKKSILIASAAVAALSIPALAHMGGHMMGGDEKSVTRAEVETKVGAMFAIVDADHDGTVTKAEAEAAHIKMKAAMRDKHFAEMDTDKNSSISRAEFDAAHNGPEMGGMRHGGMDHEDMGVGHKIGMGGHGRMGMRIGGEGMFERADVNKDGKVTLAEALAKPLAMFDAADTNKDGTLSPAERMATREKMHAMMGHKRG